MRKEKLIREKEDELKWESADENAARQDETDRWADQFNLTEIMKATEKLAKKHALVFNLYMIEGYDHDEISEIMGISSSTSRSQLSRVKQNLKEILTDQFNEQYVRS